MKLIARLLCIIACLPIFAATGDITSVQISPSGAEPYGACADITIDGFTTGKTIDFGSGRGSQLDYADIASATIVFTVVSEGYNSSGTLGTVTRTLYATSVVRKPYPNQADDQEPGATSIRVALSDFVYDDDNTGAGKSGTAPTVTIAAGAIRNDGGSMETSAVATNLTCTNSSALDYPSVFANWDIVPEQRVASDFDLRILPRHRFGIAAVEFEAIGATSTHTENETATSASTRQHSKSLLWSEYWGVSIDISGFTDPEILECKAIAYPTVGDADSVLDTDNNSDPECMQRDSITMRYDTTPVYGVVTTSGNDSTGAPSTNLATATASPNATIKGAIDDGAETVYVRTGTHNLLGLNTSQINNTHWISVLPYPGDAVSGILLQKDSNLLYEVARLKISGLRMTRAASGNSWFDGGNINYLWLDQIDWVDDGRDELSAGLGQKSLVTYITDCEILALDWRLQSVGTANSYAFILRGNEFTCVSGDAINSVYQFVGNKTGGDFEIAPTFSNHASLIHPDVLMFEFNQVMDVAGNTVPFSAGDNNSISGMSVVGNLVEISGPSLSANFLFGNNGNYSSEHLLVWHNTFVGARENIAYCVSSNRTYRNFSFLHNYWDDINHKSDIFEDDGTLTGNWPVTYKVGFRQNHDRDFQTGNNFGWDYTGLGLTTGSAGFVDDNSETTGSGTGNGDYTPDTGSALLGRIPSGQRVVTIDLYGNPVANRGDIGAIQVTPNGMTVQQRTRGFFSLVR